MCDFDLKKQIISFLRLPLVALYRLLYGILSNATKAHGIAIINTKYSHIFKNTEILSQVLRNEHVNFIEISSELNLKNILQLAKVRVVIVDQATPIISNITLHKKTCLVQIWHAGGALKKMGFAAWDGSRSDLKRIQRIHGNTDFIVTSGDYLKTIYASSFRIPLTNVLPFGLLRTDAYYGKHKRAEANKVVLWAPTFRTHKHKSHNSRYCPILASEVTNLRNSLAKKGCILAIRLHPSLQWNPDFHALNWGNKDLLDCILQSGTIITDYSSIIFDYSMFEGRIFWYFKDKVDFAKERGLYFEPEEEFPAYVAHSMDELISKLNSNLKNNTQMIRSRFMSSCDGFACSRMVNFLKTIDNSGE